MGVLVVPGARQKKQCRIFLFLIYLNSFLILMSNKDITHSMIHYLFAIHKLLEQRRRTRLIDIAKQLNVARSTATISIRNLKLKKLIVIDEKSLVQLTVKAHRYVHDALTNRSLFYYFFHNILGVDEQSAINDACLLEHFISIETQNKLFDYMKKNINRQQLIESVPICIFDELINFKNLQKGDSHLQ